MQTDAKKRVGILRGGGEEYYSSSLKRGGDIISHISENLADTYKTFDILIDKDYIWHVNGLPINPSDLMNKVDVIWNATHPSFSSVLESLSIPHISNNPFSHTLEKSRDMLRAHMKKVGVDMPRHIILPVYQKDFDGPRERYSIKKAKEVFEKFGSPWIVKPASTSMSLGGSFIADSSMGVHLANTFGELVNAIEDGVNHQTSIIVEEFIPGKVAAVHSVPDFRDQNIYIFPVINVFGNLSAEEKENLTSLAKEVHSHMDAKHYLKSIFVVNKRGKVYLTDVNSTLDLQKESSFSKVCESVGAKMHHVVHHILSRAV